MMNVPLPGNRFTNLTAATAKSPLIPSSPEPLPNQNLKQLPLSEFLQPLVTAMTQKQPWVDDFSNDPIMLPPDLYEVIKTFAKMQTPKPSSDISGSALQNQPPGQS